MLIFAIEFNKVKHLKQRIMVIIEFYDCTYSILKCIANEGTDEERTIEFPLLESAEVSINDEGYYIEFRDDELINDANLNVKIDKDYIKNFIHPSFDPPYKYKKINNRNGAGGSIIFELDIDEDEFDPRKVTIYANKSDNIYLDGLLLDYIYYDGEQIYIEDDNYEDVYQYYMEDKQWDEVEN